MARATLPRRLIWRVATLKESVPETPRVVTLRFDVAGWPGHLPGQHVDVRLTAEDGYQAQRSYSIASAPEQPQVALTVEGLEDGEVSDYLVNELRRGERIELRGPIGGYFVWEANQTEPLLLVAGGSGIVPLMSILRHRAAAGSRVPATLLYSSRSLDDVIYREELERLMADDGALKVHLTLTRVRPEGWTGYSRRVDRAMLQEVLVSSPNQTLAYVCGPTVFVEKVAAFLVEIGLPAERVLTERFGPS